MWAPVERGGGAAGAKAPTWERALAHPLQASSRAAGRAPARAPEPHEPQRQGLARREDEQEEQHLAMPDPLLNPGLLALQDEAPCGADELPQYLVNHRGAWRSLCERARAEFSVSGDIRVDASFLKGGKRAAGDVGSELGDAARPTSRKALRKSRMRIDHLEDGPAGPGSPTSGSGSERSASCILMTEHEYTERVSRLHALLREAWQRGERLQSLKLAIQCSKLLGDVSAPGYYPSLWFQLCDILDTFGDLVLERLGTLGASASETCRNWLFKAACVRELLPRLYMEIALVRCYPLLGESSAAELPAVLGRIASVIRGVGSPLIALYLRAYLAHQVALLQQQQQQQQQQQYQARPQVGDVRLSASEITNLRLASLQGLLPAVRAMLHDYLFQMQEFHQRRSGLLWSEHGLTQRQYERLHAPALEVLLRVLGAAATSPRDFEDVLRRCVASTSSGTGAANPSGSGSGSSSHEVVLGLLFQCFAPRLYARDALGLVLQVQGSLQEPGVACRVYATLAEGLVTQPPPEDHKLPLLNEVFRLVGEVADLEAYTLCAAAYVEFALRHCSEKEVAALLRHVVRRLEGQPSLPAAVHAHLERVCRAVCRAARDDFGAIVANKSLMRVLDAFKGAKKTALARQLLHAFCRSPARTGDPVVLHALLVLARDLHDSLDALSAPDDRVQACALLCRLVERIDFGTDLEQHLDALVDCRASFSELDPVKERLVRAAAELAARAHRLTQGGRRHTRRTLDFCKSCVAFGHITVPSIDCALKRAQLLQLCAQVALLNGLLPQADTLFAASIECAAQVPERTARQAELVLSAAAAAQPPRLVPSEPFLAEQLKGLLAALLPCPGQPAERGGPFWLLRKVLALLREWPHWRAASGLRQELRAAALRLLAALGQPRLQVQLHGVESNDTLFGRGRAYMAELAQLAIEQADALAEELHELRARGEAPPRRVAQLQAQLASALLLWRDQSEPEPGGEPGGETADSQAPGFGGVSRDREHGDGLGRRLRDALRLAVHDAGKAGLHALSAGAISEARRAAASAPPVHSAAWTELVRAIAPGTHSSAASGHGAACKAPASGAAAATHT